MRLLKKHYILGVLLLIAFIMFLSAGRAGADFEVVIGSIGFFGVVAILPLFLYLVFVDIKGKEERIEDIADKEGKQDKLVEHVESREAEKDETISQTRIEREPEPKKEEIDRAFIERLREERAQSREGWEKETGENKVAKDPEKEEKTRDSEERHEEKEKDT